jgi:16S rRNA processing protein RimM
MSEREEIIPVAKVGAPHCLKGELKLHLLSSSIEIVLSYGIWYIQKPRLDTWEVLEKEKVSRLGSSFLIQFHGSNTREKAAIFTGSLIGVPKKVLPKLEEDEFYWNDLIGLDVLNEKEEIFGKVKDIIETGSNEVLVCELDKSEYLIPFSSEYVTEVSLDDKRIITVWRHHYT